MVRRVLFRAGFGAAVVTVDWTTARWADGPKVAAWLEERVSVSYYSDRFGRAVCRWRAGGQADFFVLDSVLAEAHFHPSDLPDDVWTEKAPNRQPRVPKRRANTGAKLNAEMAAELRRRARQREPRAKLAAEFGVSTRTVSHVANGHTWSGRAA